MYSEAPEAQEEHTYSQRVEVEIERPNLEMQGKHTKHQATRISKIQYVG